MLRIMKFHNCPIVCGKKCGYVHLEPITPPLYLCAGFEIFLFPAVQIVLRMVELIKTFYYVSSKTGAGTASPRIVPY